MRKLIDVKNIQLRSPTNRWLMQRFSGIIERAFAIREFNEAYQRLPAFAGSNTIFKQCLDCLGVSYKVNEESLEQIPREGALVVVCNHPIGGLDAAIVLDIIMQVRQDVKLLGNFLSLVMGEVKDWIIPVNPFGGVDAAKANIKGIKQAIAWLKEGKVLVAFPAGEVAHIDWNSPYVKDPEWSHHISSIVMHVKANVLPVFIHARNSIVFQLAGLIHPLLRTALIPREILKKRCKTINVCIGKPIPFSKISSFSDTKALTDFLRASTYILQHKLEKKTFPSVIQGLFKGNIIRRKAKENFEPIAPEGNKELIKSEIANLSAAQCLFEDDSFAVFIAEACSIPNTLKEIGRLREIAFRAVEEGTGFERDIDPFDEYYKHLFLWDKTQHQIVGAYRLGLTDEILKRYGIKGLYTATLFKFKRNFVNRIAVAIELGRSFIRPEYQKEYTCLLLLWRGIGKFIARNPHYHILFGPVSISKSYHILSKRLMTYFLKEKKMNKELARHIKPRVPFKGRLPRKLKEAIIKNIVKDIDDVSVLISEVENDGKGVPILMRHYLKLNAELLSFNVDPDFSNVVDGLMLCDLRRTDPKLLSRFMGADAAKEFLKFHKVLPVDTEAMPTILKE